MGSLFRWCLMFLLCGYVLCGGINSYPEVFSYPATGPTGDPLFLTPFIEAGRETDGRKAAEVPPLLEEIKSYSGYLTVDKKHKSNLFFWYFPAEMTPETAPVAVWLQGGPGGSSMFGLFYEMGPLIIKSDLTLSRREHFWSKHIHMIYIDNPVGTGFSFTGDESGYVTNEEQVGKELHSALVQFFILFPELRSHDFFVAGESYAGKYVPALAYTIHQNNPTASVKIQLKGIAIGDGLVDPGNMMKYGDYLLQLGFIDQNALGELHRMERLVVEAIRQGRYGEATAKWDALLEMFRATAGNIDLYDYTRTGESEISGEILSRFLSQSRVRKSIHVGNLTFNDGKTVYKYLQLDMMKSVRPWFQVLLENYRVLLYNGQFDVIVAYPLTVNFVKKLEWSGSADYKVAMRKQWYVGNELAGYYKTTGNFTELIVRDAGHMVPSDQPKWAHVMMTRFVYNVPLSISSGVN